MLLNFAAAYFFVFLLVWRSFRANSSRAVGLKARFAEAFLALNWWYFGAFAIAYLLKPEQNR